MSSSGKIGNLTIDSDGLAYNQVTENGKTYYKSKLYNGGLIYRENYNSTDSDWDQLDLVPCCTGKLNREVVIISPL